MQEQKQTEISDQVTELGGNKVGGNIDQSAEIHVIPTIQLGMDRPTRLAKRRVPLNDNNSDMDIGQQFKLHNQKEKESDPGDHSYAPNFGARAQPRRGRVAESGETNQLLNKKDPFASLDSQGPAGLFGKAV